MKSGIIHFNNIQIEEVSVIALKNNIKLTQQNLIELSFKIATNCIKYLDKETINQVTGLKC